jgi:hypothetical protein
MESEREWIYVYYLIRSNNIDCRSAKLGRCVFLQLDKVERE